jgi:GT2 family glycosyltransferase
MTVAELGRVGCVFLHYRHWPRAGAALDALLSQGVDRALVRIVDNASGDGSVNQIQADYPDLAVITRRANDGYGPGMNTGAASLPLVDAFLFVTHDCVLHPGALNVLRQRLSDDPSIGVVGPLLEQTSKPGRVFSAGGTLRGRTHQPAHVGSGRPLADFTDAPPRAVEWLDGACLLVRSDTYDRVGGIDEGFFLYFEELDFLCRVRRDGWRAEVVPSAIASQEPGHQPQALLVRNRLRFLRRNYSRTVASMRLMADGRDIVAGLCSNDTHRRRQARLALRGVVGFLAGTEPRRLARLG